MTGDLLTISNAAQDVSNSARELHAMTRAFGLARAGIPDGILADRMDDLHTEFLNLADALGYDVTRRAAPAVAEAAE